MEPSIFTKIISGEIPCHKVYEDDRVLAFLDIEPVTEGHTLVIPKKQVDHLWDLEDELYRHLMEVSKQVANRQREVLQPKRVGMAVEGFNVPHAHVHVFPMERGLAETINGKIPKPTPEQLAAVAKRLAF
jgi:histidine triad (HIT) family protein